MMHSTNKKSLNAADNGVLSFPHGTVKLFFSLLLFKSITAMVKSNNNNNYKTNQVIYYFIL